MITTLRTELIPEKNGFWSENHSLALTAAVGELAHVGECRGRRAPVARVIVHTPEPSHGAARYVAELVAALARVGAPVVLFCPANFEYEAPVREAGGGIVHASRRDVSPAGLLSRLARNFRFVMQTALAQFRLARRGDVVHFQNPMHLPLGFVFYLLVMARGASIVLTAHDPLPHRWRFPRAAQWLERWMLGVSYRLCDRIIVHNEKGKEVLLREFQQSAERIAVVPHGPYPEAEETGEGASYPRFDCLRLLAFGSIRENKGLHLAIRAVQTAASEPVPRVCLTIAGGVSSAEEQYWLACRRLIATHPGVIEVIERPIDDDEIGPLMARHHAVILPYTEFFSESGVASLALSHRRPILATTSGGLGELMERSGCGIPISSPDPGSVSRAIRTALRLGPDQLQQMGIAGNRFIRQARSWDRIADETIAVYSQLVANAGFAREAGGADERRNGMGENPMGNGEDTACGKAGQSTGATL